MKFLIVNPSPFTIRIPLGTKCLPYHYHVLYKTTVLRIVPCGCNMVSYVKAVTQVKVSEKKEALERVVHLFCKLKKWGFK